MQISSSVRSIHISIEHFPGPDLLHRYAYYVPEGLACDDDDDDDACDKSTRILLHAQSLELQRRSSVVARISRPSCLLNVNRTHGYDINTRAMHRKTPIPPSWEQEQEQEQEREERANGSLPSIDCVISCIRHIPVDTIVSTHEDLNDCGGRREEESPTRTDTMASMYKYMAAEMFAASLSCASSSVVVAERHDVVIAVFVFVDDAFEYRVYYLWMVPHWSTERAGGE
ncbi:hypothetical protein K504DRAFT_491780 [Pleomassaria siparia CBS 279.74]|uniref:Uncharacterized protein n=1 Tax=Pleomassaria siparia CBS 279.74 TaxID=1314801 RepID=A0A6G1K569_9PLEO|nr:hypothetical protein K504DRAFT_491780 [Pleomassaria siparia CBS 279.74]